MNLTDQIHIAQFAAGLGLLLFGYSFMYVRTRLDRFREDLFDLRDELFDYMLKNRIPFTMPAYGVLRDALNGNIRFARKTWLFGLWFTAFASRDEVLFPLHESHGPIVDEIEKIPDPSVRLYFRGVHQRMGSRILDYIFLEGPLWSIALPLKLYLRRRGAVEAQKRMGFYVMADEAAQLGKPDSREAKQLLQCSV